MKNTFTLLLLLCVYTLFAQPEFYGVSEFSGGSIFKYNAAGNTLTTVYKHQVHEVFPVGNLSLGTDGKLYGMTLNGGVDKTGAIFSYDATSGAYTLLYTFITETGSQPTGIIAWGADGKMYGLTTYGGAFNNGVLFSFDTKTKAYTKLFDFDGIRGANPIGGLLVDTDGKLYGTTQLGGGNDYGVLFSYDPVLHALTKHIDFDLPSGGYPAGGLAKGKDGKLYGATSFGGPEEWHAGAIYQFDPLKDSRTNLYYFNWDNNLGDSPVGSFTLMADGNLYGVTEGGGANHAGTIFSFDPVRLAYTKLYDFGSANGDRPGGGLVADAKGLLFGMTREGNSKGVGGIYSFDPTKKLFRNSYDFQYADGAYPAGSLCLAKDGRLFGITPFGGEPEYGVLFAFNPQTSVYTKVKEFDEAPDGAFPIAAMTMHNDGNYYGSTIGGGHYGKGVIYSFNPVAQQYQPVYRFGTADGQHMGSTFLCGKDGKLYGMMNNGGAGNAGSIFSFDPASHSVEQLYNFAYTEGAYPGGALLQGDDGKLYGTAGFGGQGDHGVIFSFDLASHRYGKMFEFSGANGEIPMDGLTLGTDGKLYGVTQWGGLQNKGVVYAFDPVTKSFTSLLDFTGANGENPLWGLTLGRNKKLYGTTPNGGTYGRGVLYSYDPQTQAFSLLYHFGQANGAHPSGRLTLGNDGRLYGFTQKGGNKDMGVVYVFDPATAVYTKLKDFDGSGSGNPVSSGMAEFCTQMQTFYRDRDGDGDGNSAIAIRACAAPPGYVATGTDCNDADATIHPKAAEICGNGIDDNCNGQVDEDCDPTPLLLVNDITVLEAKQEAVITIRLAKAVNQTVKVHFKTESGTAKAGQDFIMHTGLLQFPAGSTTASINVRIIPDQLKEGPEFFYLMLSKPKGAKLKNEIAKVTILDKYQPVLGTTVAANSFRSKTLEASALKISSYPNPSAHQFALVATSTSTEPLSVFVVDAAGRAVETRRSLPANQTFVLGAQYPPGFYLVRVIQDGASVQVKLLKQP